MRTIEEVQKEYQMQAALLGDLEYRLDKLSEDRKRMMINMHNLQVEAEKINKANAKDAKAKVALPDATPVPVNPEA
jgi:hypothetical protein